jgi:hypothetical protein
MNWSIKTARELEKVFEPYCIMFKELKGKKKQLPSQCFCKAKNTKCIKTLLGVGGKLFVD